MRICVHEAQASAEDEAEEALPGAWFVSCCAGSKVPACGSREVAWHRGPAHPNPFGRDDPNAIPSVAGVNF